MRPCGPRRADAARGAPFTAAPCAHATPMPPRSTPSVFLGRSLLITATAPNLALDFNFVTNAVAIDPRTQVSIVNMTIENSRCARARPCSYQHAAWPRLPRAGVPQHNVARCVMRRFGHAHGACGGVARLAAAAARLRVHVRAGPAAPPARGCAHTRSSRFADARPLAGLAAPGRRSGGLGLDFFDGSDNSTLLLENVVRWRYVCTSPQEAVKVRSARPRAAAGLQGHCAGGVGAARTLCCRRRASPLAALACTPSPPPQACTSIAAPP